MSPPYTLTALAVAVLGLAGCAGNPEPKAQAAESDHTLAPGPWRLVSWTLEDAPIPDGANATLTIDSLAGRASGHAGCNSFSGAWKQDGTALALGPFILTKKMCMDPEGVMAFEQAYMAALEGATGYSVDGRQLALHTGEGQSLVFEPAAAKTAMKAVDAPPAFLANLERVP